MRIALQIPEVDQGIVIDATRALANYNARTYRCRVGEVCTRPPWGLQYDASDGDSSVVAGEPTIVMRDAVALMRAGSGACGELSAAYAGWLISRGASVELVAPQTRSDDDPKGPAWHVMVVWNGVTLDPMRADWIRSMFAADGWRNAHGMR